MSNALAVAHVTQALALLIESNLRPEIDMAVSVETRKPPAEPPLEPTITVFLYQVTHNPSMRNYDLPTRASDGRLLNKAVAALDLHYVISAYGEENELVGQRLIGCVARILREFPVLPADVIQEAGERPYLAGSNLALAEQKVRFTPLQMDIDETSKLWGMLHQTPYALSMTYQGSLVLVEGREEPERSRPVERTVVTVGASVPPHGNTGAANGGSGVGSGGGQGAAGAPGAPGVSVAADGAEGEDGDAREGATSAKRAVKEAEVPAESPALPAEKPAERPAVKEAAGSKPAAKSTAAKNTAARKTAAKSSAKSTAAKNTAAKKATAVKQAAAKKSAAQNTAVRKTTAKKQPGGGRSGRGAAGGGTRNSGTDNTSDGKES
ncbi:DUF4255 domain-containing protein [Streptomyces sp. WMMB 322]|uniref:DUF4255 domain-containing protein n=1 Tax=Streptomyces sp. WMMB 322 TaxID=1286821 RepID=UPI00082376F2|nr:DUF4255 domain-containing protein [Streptomyces sp. WMMB 322]SCK08517.1 Protein of unknown function [Streptomyces sp. WMMB 322]